MSNRCMYCNAKEDLVSVDIIFDGTFNGRPFRKAIGWESVCRKCLRERLA